MSPAPIITTSKSRRQHWVPRGGRPTHRRVADPSAPRNRRRAEVGAWCILTGTEPALTIDEARLRVQAHEFRDDRGPAPHCDDDDDDEHTSTLSTRRSSAVTTIRQRRHYRPERMVTTIPRPVPVMTIPRPVPRSRRTHNPLREPKVVASPCDETVLRLESRPMEIDDASAHDEADAGDPQDQPRVVHVPQAEEDKD